MAEKPTKKAADLKELDLATGIDRVPELWNRHGNTVLIGITILALGYALWTFRHNTTLQAKQASEQNLASARELMGLLRSDVLNLSPEAYSNLRRQVLTEGSTALSDVLAKTDDDSARLQALLLRGDLYYAVGMLPDPAAATTRPTLKLAQEPESLFRTAQESYQEVLTRYTDHPTEAAAARLGLAAVAENRSDFDGARGFYETVANDAKAASNYRETAKQRLTLLPSLARPVRIRISTAPTTAPMPFLIPDGTGGSATTSQPTSQPAAR